jgi:hypothetical protein
MSAKNFAETCAGSTVTAVLMPAEEIKKRQDDLKILNLIKISKNV